MDSFSVKLASDIEIDSIVNGPGLRMVVWMQGCNHNCEGCHNKDTHDINKGKIVNLDFIKQFIFDNRTQDGITLSGGDPLLQLDASLEIAAYSKILGINTWCYTGYTYETLQKLSKTDKRYLMLLQNLDVLVDGKFEINKKSHNLMYCGSTNQRVIDVQKSLSSNKVILYKNKYENSKVEVIKEKLFV